MTSQTNVVIDKDTGNTDACSRNARTFSGTVLNIPNQIVIGRKKHESKCGPVHRGKLRKTVSPNWKKNQEHHLRKVHPRPVERKEEVTCSTEEKRYS